MSKAKELIILCEGYGLGAFLDDDLSVEELSVLYYFFLFRGRNESTRRNIEHEAKKQGIKALEGLLSKKYVKEDGSILIINDNHKKWGNMLTMIFPSFVNSYGKTKKFIKDKLANRDENIENFSKRKYNN